MRALGISWSRGMCLTGGTGSLTICIREWHEWAIVGVVVAGLCGMVGWWVLLVGWLGFVGVLGEGVFKVL